MVPCISCSTPIEELYLQTSCKFADSGTLKGLGDAHKGESEPTSFLFQSPAAPSLELVSQEDSSGQKRYNTHDREINIHELSLPAI